MPRDKSLDVHTLNGTARPVSTVMIGHTVVRRGIPLPNNGAMMHFNGLFSLGHAAESPTQEAESNVRDPATQMSRLTE